MKAYWWQGGLHFKPETDKEHDALLVVARSLSYFEPTDEVPTGDWDLERIQACNQDAVVPINKGT